MLIAADGYRNAGTWHDKRADVADLEGRLPGDVRVIEILRAEEPGESAGDTAGTESWDEAVARGLEIVAEILDVGLELVGVDDARRVEARLRLGVLGTPGGRAARVGRREVERVGAGRG